DSGSRRLHQPGLGAGFGGAGAMLPRSPARGSADGAEDPRSERTLDKATDAGVDGGHCCLAIGSNLLYGRRRGVFEEVIDLEGATVTTSGAGVRVEPSGQAGTITIQLGSPDEAASWAARLQAAAAAAASAPHSRQTTPSQSGAGGPSASSIRLAQLRCRAAMAEKQAEETSAEARARLAAAESAASQAAAAREQCAAAEHRATEALARERAARLEVEAQTAELLSRAARIRQLEASLEARNLRIKELEAERTKPAGVESAQAPIA
ncbi:unnamed protein product, partial [Prorocentrum cordatum]